MNKEELRDHFAGLAMQVYLTKLCEAGKSEKFYLTAPAAYEVADAMLEEREKRESGGGDNE